MLDAPELEVGLLFPPQSKILETELQAAAAVAKVVFDRGLERVERPADLDDFVRKKAYRPCTAPPITTRE